MLEFSREYGSRAHPNQRSGLSPQSIPHLQTVDELVMKSEKLRDSLMRIREVVQQQHAAMEDQMKDPNRDSHMRYASEANGSYSDKMEGAGGFANGEGKKRRGVGDPQNANSVW
jgi:glutamate--cysteine ligase catalytic subunit